jgi:predicted acylesterase/phospholipase RssA
VSNSGYWESLLSDGGFVSGIQLRKWLGQQIVNSPLMAMATAQASPAARNQIPRDGTKVTFRQLYQMLGSQMQLAVVGTNLTTGRPVVFSPTSTPDFPVADAVAISSSFPGVFKPAWVGYDAPFGGNNLVGNLAGWYADGGIINNVPIHVFDQKSGSGQAVVSTDPYLHPLPDAAGGLPPLDEHMLSLRLEQGDPPPSALPIPQRDPPAGTLGPELTASLVWDAFNFQANAGQIRSPREAKQTVLLYTNGVGLFDFVASSPQGAWTNASNEIMTYYTVPPR